MNPRSQSGFRMLSRVASCFLLACLLNVSGCTSKTPTGEGNSPPAAETLVGNAEDLVASPSDPSLLAGSASGNPAVNAPIPAPTGGIAQPNASTPGSESLFAGTSSNPEGVKVPTISVPRRLRPDLSPQELVEFLAGADQDMQKIYSGAAGVRDNNEAVTRMREIGKLKLEAAKRLRDHADANQEQQVEASRGVLQSLSHLAALGDLDSANTLEELANENLQADDPRVVTDSRLVLIGFAIESLQHGKDEAPGRIIELVQGFRQSPTKPDVPMMMVLGQARQVLAEYGHDEQAGIVRQVIIDLFANAEDPQIASMAARLAGSTQFDEIDQMLESAIAGGQISVATWNETAEQLIGDSPDIMTVQYLAGAALEFEATRRDDLSEVTYDLLSKRFGDRSDAIGQETRIAIDARDARRSVIGLTFDPALAQIDGEPLSMSQFDGKVVLMPFWASGFPQSLQILPLLMKIRDSHPDEIVIVGMNLDPEDAPTLEFVEQNRLDFPSYHSVSSPTAKIANSVATRFGMVSMPFVAVLDQQGRVASLDFKGQKLEQIVDQLLSK